MKHAGLVLGLSYEEIKHEVEKVDPKYSLLTKEELMKCYNDYMQQWVHKRERNHSYEEGEKSQSSEWWKWSKKKKRKHSSAEEGEYGN